MWSMQLQDTIDVRKVDVYLSMEISVYYIVFEVHTNDKAKLYILLWQNIPPLLLGLTQYNQKKLERKKEKQRKIK